MVSSFWRKKQKASLLSSCQHHNNGVTSSIVLLPYMRMKYPCLPWSNCLHNWFGSRAQLYDLHYSNMGRNWYTTLVLNMSDHMRYVLMWNCLFYILHFACFVKALRWLGVTRFSQPHVHMHMFCPYVDSTLCCLLEELQMRTFKRYFSCTILVTTLHLREMN